MKFSLRSLLMLIVFISTVTNAEEEIWRGLVVAPENRCSEYDKKKDYTYSQDVELEIIESMGGNIFGPYTKRCYTHRDETDIEHIVATSEAHDSGLCRKEKEGMRKQFASDISNLTLASSYLNRYIKKHYDAAEWLPKHNQCWFAERIVEVRKAYDLTIDRAEADALDRILANCNSFDMELYLCDKDDNN